MYIIVLEDNPERQAVMSGCLRDRFHQYNTMFFDNAQEMQAFLRNNLPTALLISLDHDLVAKPQKNGQPCDPGTGRDVADFLAQQVPCCPIVIHTTNAAAGDGMEFLLREVQWEVHRVHPFGDMEWIPSVWFRTVRNAIVGTARPPAPSDRHRHT